MRKHRGAARKFRLHQKQDLLAQFGVVCQFPGCELELHDDRALIDIHHFGPADTTLLCPYHHRLADKGYLTQKMLKNTL
jgi:hypothetical protein